MKKFIIIQILGLIIAYTEILTIKEKDKNKIFIHNNIINIVSLIQYTIMNAFSGVLSILVTFIRNIVFKKYSKENKKAPVIWLILIGLFLLGAQYASYNTIISIIPLINVLIYTYALWQQDIKIFKVLNMITYIFSGIYYLFYGAYINAIADTIFTMFSIYEFMKRKTLE